MNFFFTYFQVKYFIVHLYLYLDARAQISQTNNCRIFAVLSTILLSFFIEISKFVDELSVRPLHYGASTIRHCVQLPVPSTDVMVPSLGDRAFPVAGARAWNAFLSSVTSAPSLSSFRLLPKTFLFQRQLRQ